VPGQPIRVEGIVVVIERRGASPPARTFAPTGSEMPYPLRNVKILPVDAGGQSTVFPDH
jgi:hypothetical protein